MTPINYTQEGENVTFHYSFKQLREFILRGKEHGDTGWILVKKEGNLKFYRGHSIRVVIPHCPIFSGGEFSIEAIMNPPKPKPFTFSHSIITLDMSKTKKIDWNKIKNIN